MTDDSIQINEGTGKRLQAFKNNIGGLDVESEAISIVSSNTGLEVGTASSPLYVGVTGGTVTATGTVLASGTINTVFQSGTIQMLNGGTINTLQSGTLNTLNSGTLQTVSNIVSINSLGTLNSGTLQTVSNVVSINSLGTLNSGTITTVSTVTSVGSATVFSKHDLHTYLTAFANLTGAGTIVSAVGGTLIKVHQYRLSTDGTFTVRFMDAPLPTGGTLDATWDFQQREGVTSPFIPYPAYHFATRAGSALTIGTLNVSPAGTLHVSVIYTAVDTS